MIRIAAMLMAAATPAVAQVTPVTFEFGKNLPLAVGQWSYAGIAGGGEARFGRHLALRCDRATRTLTIARPVATAAALTIVTDMQTRALPTGGRLSANDPILDSMAFSRGRFLVVGGSAEVLAVPSWPEAARAIEDCRK